jgi:hypothetical protein
MPEQSPPPERSPPPDGMRIAEIHAAIFALQDITKRVRPMGVRLSVPDDCGALVQGIALLDDIALDDLLEPIIDRLWDTISRLQEDEEDRDA